MKILIAEDDVNKLQILLQFLSEVYPSAITEVAKSFHSAKAKVLQAGYDVILLDMQLPQFDKTQNEEGGRRRSLAGMELLRQMKRKSILTPAIVVTQFREFGDDLEILSLDQLSAQLHAMGVSNFRGLVYYDPKITNWRTELQSKIQSSLR